MMLSDTYVPDYRLLIDGAPIPAALRASITSVTLQSGLEGSDRLEIGLVNEGLRWLDHPLLGLGHEMTLQLGYASAPLEQLFVGSIVAQDATFPGAGAPTLTIAAQDGRHGMQQGTRVRWFAIPIPTVGNMPLPDMAVASLVSLENTLIPIFEPVGAALSVLIGGASVVAALGDPDAMQKVIRKQDGESDFDFLQRIARENGWEMLIDHAGSLGGYALRFMAPLGNLDPELTLRYGQSLIDFTPRITTVGQILGVSAQIWRPEIKMSFTISVSWNWDSQSLDLRITPGFGLPGGLTMTPEGAAAAVRKARAAEAEQAALEGNAPQGEEAAEFAAETEAEAQRSQQAAASKVERSSASAEFTLVDEPVTLASAPRVIVGTLIPRLNRRLTGSGSTIGNPRIRAGAVLRLEGLGAQFGGLYRVTAATHTLDSSGYRTGFEVRKEIWFGSIPLPEQGAVPVRVGL
jgi:phage protein D